MRAHRIALIVGVVAAAAAGLTVTPAAAAGPPAPANDDFAHAQALTGSAGDVTTSNAGATTEPGEADTIAGLHSGASIWYSFTAPTYGTLLVGSCGDPDLVVVGVSTGAALGSLTPSTAYTGCNGRYTDALLVKVLPGTTYRIVLAGIDQDTSAPYQGPIGFSWRFTEATRAAGPTHVYVQPESHQVTVSWPAPEDDGGADITGYVITARVNGVEKATKTVGTEPVPQVVTGLPNGKPYRFDVAAITVVGVGYPSPPSETVITGHPWFPFAGWSDYVKRQYHDIAGSTPTASSLASWVAKLDANDGARADLVVALRRSPDNVTNVDPLIRLYRALLARPPDSAGLHYWIGRHRAGTATLADIATTMATGRECRKLWFLMTNTQFVDHLYDDVLGSSADASGRRDWVKKLDEHRSTRAAAAAHFAALKQAKGYLFWELDAEADYALLLHRGPTSDELSQWIFPTRGDPLSAILGSAEYQLLLRSA
ncbi:DUF4214 domain-containing protein [Aquihabitans sp. McL0605]|uniref:DUF4214 domain-containing protein n=1 Tax=Aquihabitans sp. McL0605 TaxID=3415671 RepID=UPI003CF3FC68